MPEPSVPEFRERFGIHSQIPDTRIEFCLLTALGKVKRKIGQDAYDEIFNSVTPPTATLYDSPYFDQDGTATNEGLLRTQEVTDAAHYFTAALVVLNTSLYIRPAGLVKREQDAASPAMTSSMQVVNEYLPPDEVADVVASLNAQADEFIGLYVLPPDPMGEGGAQGFVYLA